MLYIDDKKIEIISQEIFVGKFTNNGNIGYNINISLTFINSVTKEKGYINLDAGFEKDNSISSFLNREYVGLPFGHDNAFIFIEVFDTEKFLDTELESEIIVKINDIKNNKVKVFFEVNDELIKIKYDGYTDINLNRTKDSFIGSDVF